MTDSCLAQNVGSYYLGLWVDRAIAARIVIFRRYQGYGFSVAQALIALLTLPPLQELGSGCAAFSCARAMKLYLRWLLAAPIYDCITILDRSDFLVRGLLSLF
jgi:hypothetical protein